MDKYSRVHEQIIGTKLHLVHMFSHLDPTNVGGKLATTPRILSSLKHWHKDFCFYPHSAWSESSAACPRPWGGRRWGEKLATGAFATLERRGPQGQAHIWAVFSCKGAERDEWRGPKGRADTLSIIVLWRKDDRAVRP